MGTLSTLARQEGFMPSVKATKAWLRKVKVHLKDVEGLPAAVNRLVKDPRGTTRAHMVDAVVDPIGSAYNSVRDAVDDVYDDMGGGEADSVGAQVMKAAIAKDSADEVNDLVHGFRHMQRADSKPDKLQGY